MNRKRTKHWYINHKEEEGIIYRRCTNCNEWFVESYDFFHYANKSYPEKGFTSRCKTCNVIRTKLWQENNPEKYKESTKNKNQNISDVTKSIRRKLSKEQRLNGYQKQYQQNNPEKLRNYGEKRKLKDHKITKEEWESCKEYFNNACAYCGLKQEYHFIKRKGELINMNLHKEHVDDEGCGDLENCVPACQSCNSRKHNFKLDEWYNEENENFTEERYSKIIKWITEDYKIYIKPKKPKGKYTKDPNNPRWKNCL